MKKYFIQLTVLFFLLSACNSKENKEQIKQQIIDTENNFVKTLQDNGLHDAFVEFADEDAVIIRGPLLIKGKKAIDEHYKNQHTKDLIWKVDFVDVSESGDLGYTYGEYVYTYKDSIGNQKEEKGVFNTIWKRQKDGNWKYVKD